MKKIRVSDLKPGTIFSEPVFVDGENMLVPKGVPLRDADLERLKRWKIEEVQSDGAPVSRAETAGAAAAESGIAWRLNQRLAPFLKMHRTLMEQVDRIFQDIAAGTSVGHEGIDSIVNEILDKSRTGRNEMIQLVLADTDPRRKQAVSAVNCAILSTVTGMTLKLTGHRLLQLVTGALLHDVGMVRIPAEILQKKGRLSPQEKQHIHTHPVTGYRIISRELKYPEDVALVALQHQERWDGKGYPRQLRTEEIILPARIVAVAEAYEAMVNIRPFRDPQTGHKAMRAILSDNGRHFDPQVLRAFLESLGIYPIGSIVQLNNSSIGRVVENHVGAPMRPKIEILIDEHSARVEHADVINLQEHRQLFILKVIDPREVREPVGSGESPDSGELPGQAGGLDA